MGGEATTAVVSEGLETILEKTAEVVRVLTSLDENAALDDEFSPSPIAGHVEVITQTLNKVCLELHQAIDDAPECARLSKAPYTLRLAQETLREAIALQLTQPNEF